MTRPDSLMFHISTLILLYSQPLVADGSNTLGGFESPYNDEIKCYALPYGGFGFASHILTYYTMTVMCFGRRPLAPWSDLEGPRKWNISLAVVKLIFTIVPSLVTMARCSHAWQFEAMAGMKLALSLTSGMIALFPEEPFWALLYLPGVIAGTAGTISLVASNLSHPIRIITGVFGVVAFICSIVAVIIGCHLWKRGHGGHGCFAGLLIFIYGCAAILPFLLIFGALYSDWVLAVVEDNLVGYPYGRNKGIQVLWVFYMIGKRLNLFMI